MRWPLRAWCRRKQRRDQTARRVAIQLLIEYDPQPPYDSGHFSKASAAVKREAAALVAREGGQLLARDPQAMLREASAIPTVLWKGAIRRARTNKRWPLPRPKR